MPKCSGVSTTRSAVGRVRLAASMSAALRDCVEAQTLGMYAEVAVSGFTQPDSPGLARFYSTWAFVQLAAYWSFSGSSCAVHTGLLGVCCTRAFIMVLLHMGLLAAHGFFLWDSRSLLWV